MYIGLDPVCSSGAEYVGEVIIRFLGLDPSGSSMDCGSRRGRKTSETYFATS